MMNEKLLKSFMAKYGDTQQSLADALGISRSRINSKIKGKGASFRQNEIWAIKKRYHMSADDVDAVFFASRLSLKDKITE